MLLGATFGIANMVVPSGGPKCVPVLGLDFSNNASILLDGTQIVQQGKIEYIQGVYIDNSSNANPLSLTMSTTGQVITAKAHTQGYYSLMVPDPPQITAQTTQTANLVIPMFFYNVPIQPQVWSTV